MGSQMLLGRMGHMQPEVPSSGSTKLWLMWKAPKRARGRQDPGSLLKTDLRGRR